jgi:hypothetical protein
MTIGGMWGRDRGGCYPSRLVDVTQYSEQKSLRFQPVQRTVRKGTLKESKFIFAQRVRQLCETSKHQGQCRSCSGKVEIEIAPCPIVKI